MKKLVYFFMFFIGICNYAQTNSVFTENFSGVESVQYNPANIADSFYKVDVHAISINGNLGNTFATVKPFEVLSDFKFKALKEVSNTSNFLENSGLQQYENYISNEKFTDNSSVYGNASILGPSVMWMLNRNNSIAFTTALKLNGSGGNLNTKLYNFLEDNDFIENVQTLDDLGNKQIQGFGHAFAWGEIGLSYATILKQSATAILKVGGSLKLMKGIHAYSFSFDDFESQFNLNLENPEASKIGINGLVNVTNSVAGTNFGQGLDIGFVYEKRTKTLPYLLKDSDGLYYGKSPYQYKISGSITDIGTLNFNKIQISKNTVNVNLPDQVFDINNFTDVSNVTSTEKVSYSLPTTAHLNFDYHLKNHHWFLNANLDWFLRSKTAIKQLKTITTFSVTPRYESAKFSAFLPFSINENGLFTSGVGVRTKYVSLGSTTFFTNFTNISREANVYVSVRIPIKNKKVKKEFKRSLEVYYY